MLISRYDNTASYFANYCSELYANRNEIINTVQDLVIEEQTAHYLRNYPRSSTAGTVLLCRQLFDIASLEQNLSSEHRLQAGRVGGLMLILTDIVDGQIDRPVMPLEAKERYLDEGTHLLLTGTKSNFMPENKDQKVSFKLARYLHEVVVQADEKERFASLFRDLISDIKCQFLSDDLEEHLKLTRRIGEACALLGVLVIERTTDMEHHQTCIAAASIGAYAEFLDHAYEMHEDIRYAIPTYATLYLAQHGDNPVNRKQAKEDLLDLGSEMYREGLAALDGKQRSIYRATCRMLDVRYRLIKRVGSIGDTLYG